jgi:hypothetical protein
METGGGPPTQATLRLRRASPAVANAVIRALEVVRGSLWEETNTYFVSLCSVCLRHRLQNFESFSFSAFARLFFVLE